MSEAGSEAPPPETKKAGWLKWAIGALLAVGVVAVVYVIAAASFKPHGPADLSDLKTGALAAMVIPKTPTPAPDAEFFDGAGKPVHLADFKGSVVVMNLWATWCPPCIRELPSLGKLQAAYTMQQFKVLAVSVDKPEVTDLVRTRLAAAAPLEEYRDPKYKLVWGLNPQPPGFPATIIYDRKGMERARLEAPADWNSPEVRKLVERLLAEP